MDEHSKGPDDDAADAGVGLALQAATPLSPLDLATLDRLEANVRAEAVRARRRRHRQMLLAAGAVAAALVMIVAAVAWPGRTSERVSTGPTAPAGTGIGRLLVVTGNGVETWSVSGRRQPGPIGVVSSGTISLPTGGAFCCRDSRRRSCSPHPTQSFGMSPTVAWNENRTRHYGIYRVPFPRRNPIRAGYSPGSQCRRWSHQLRRSHAGAERGLVRVVGERGHGLDHHLDAAGSCADGVHRPGRTARHRVAGMVTRWTPAGPLHPQPARRPGRRDTGYASRSGPDNPHLVEGRAGQGLLDPHPATPGAPGWTGAVFRGATNKVTFWSSWRDRRRTARPAPA